LSQKGEISAEHKQDVVAVEARLITTMRTKSTIAPGNLADEAGSCPGACSRPVGPGRQKRENQLPIAGKWFGKNCAMALKEG